MVVNTTFNGILISAREAGEGKNGKYYNVSLEQNDASCELSCNKDVYDAVKSGVVPKYSQALFYGQVNTQYGSFKVVDIVNPPQAKK